MKGRLKNIRQTPNNYKQLKQEMMILNWNVNSFMNRHDRKENVNGEEEPSLRYSRITLIKDF